MIYILATILVILFTVGTRLGKFNVAPHIAALGQGALALVATALSGGSAWVFLAAIAFFRGVNIAVNAVFDKKKPTDDSSVVGKWFVSKFGPNGGEILFYCELLLLIVLVL